MVIVSVISAKTWLITKEGFHNSAASTIANTEVNITTNGRPYIGAAIRSKEYVKEVESKINEWIANVQCLAKIAETQPHAAFSALTHGTIAKWTHLILTIPGIDPLLDAMWSTLLTALTGRPPPSVLERSLFALPRL